MSRLTKGQLRRREYQRAYQQAYRKSPQGIAARKAHEQTARCKSLKRNWQRNQTKDSTRRISQRLRIRLYSALLTSAKRGSAVRDLGCTVDELKQMLQADLDRYGFTWADHAMFAIDHIVPLASFDLNCRGQLLRAVHFSNLGILSVEENSRKHDTDPHEWASFDAQREAYRDYVR